jgi:hypothetical protein
MDLLGDLEPPPIGAPDAFAVATISAVARQGIDELLAILWKKLQAMERSASPRTEDAALP